MALLFINRLYLRKVRNYQRIEFKRLLKRMLSVQKGIKRMIQKLHCFLESISPMLSGMFTKYKKKISDNRIVNKMLAKQLDGRKV